MGKKSKIVFSTDPDYNEEHEQSVATQANDQQQLRVLAGSALEEAGWSQ